MTKTDFNLTEFQQKTLLCPKNREVFCGKFPKLYHSVPKQYSDIFESGELYLQPVSGLRHKEDEYEGTLQNGYTTEFYVFCMSKNADVQRPYERVLYAVNLRRLTDGIVTSLENDKLTVEDTAFNLYGSGLSVRGRIGAMVAGDEVRYISMKDNNEHSAFLKDFRFLNEQEVRIAVYLCIPDGYGEGPHRPYTLTTKKPVKLPINPTGCFYRIG